jgi:hypothetical protein
MKSAFKRIESDRKQISLCVTTCLIDSVFEHQERMSKNEGGANVSFNLAFLSLTQYGVAHV